MTKRILNAFGATIVVLSAVTMLSCGSAEEEADRMLGTWRITQISENGRPSYQIASAPVLVDLQFSPGGSAMRITSQVATGQVDTTAMTYQKTATEMTVTSPAETVTYGYTISADGNTATFTNAGRVLQLQRVAG